MLIAVEYYGVAITLLAKSRGEKNYALNLIPFVAPFYVQKYTGGFRMLVIPVKKWGQTVLIFAAVIALSVYCGTACFGYFITEQAEAIRSLAPPSPDKLSVAIDTHSAIFSAFTSFFFNE